MKIDLNRSLDLPVSADRAWNFLDRIEAVASCLPGAAITEKVDETHYKGTVSVRLGPVNLNFAGLMEIVSRDPAGRVITLAGKGSDKTGTSVAEMTLTASVLDTGPGASRIQGDAGITVNGKAAAMGARMMDSVAEQLIKEFYANVLKTLQAAPEPVAEGAAAAPEAAAATPAAATQAARLDGFAFIWNVLKAFFAGLFARKKVAS